MNDLNNGHSPTSQIVISPLRRFMGILGGVGSSRSGFVLAALLACVCIGLPAAFADIQEINGDLLDEIETIRSNMPGRDSEGFDPPTGAELSTWRLISDALLDEEIDTVDSLVTADLPMYELFLLTDTGFDSSDYYLLRETFAITRGWGTLILKLDHEREIAIEVPHPRYEINTPSEGGDVFRRTGARFFVMAGTHRCANSAVSQCDGSSSVCGDGSYHVSDMAHFVDAAYQVAHEAFTDRYPQGYSFSLHGTGNTSCEDIFLSNGHATDSQQILYDLRDHMLASGDITVGVAGDGVSSCPLAGSTNVQGRYTNGSLDPCYEGVTSAAGLFIHAEQQRRVRDSFAVYSKFIGAIRAAIPAIGASVPPVTHPGIGIDLSEPHPNPCTSIARFRLGVPRTQRVKVEVFDLLGQRVALIHEGVVITGRPQTLELDARGLASGVYFVRASGGCAVATRRVTILR